MFISKVRLRRHQFPCWYTPELRHLSKRLHSAKKRFSKHATPRLQLKINDLESEYRSKILLAKSNYESQLIQSFGGSHNSKIYDYIRALCKDSTIPPVVPLNTSNATSDTDKAELFNTFFHSVFTGSSFSLSDMSTLPMPPSCICTISSFIPWLLMPCMEQTALPDLKACRTHLNLCYFYNGYFEFPNSPLTTRQLN